MALEAFKNDSSFGGMFPFGMNQKGPLKPANDRPVQSFAPSTNDFLRNSTALGSTFITAGTPVGKSYLNGPSFFAATRDDAKDREPTAAETFAARQAAAARAAYRSPYNVTAADLEAAGGNYDYAMEIAGAGQELSGESAEEEAYNEKLAKQMLAVKKAQQDNDEDNEPEKAKNHLLELFMGEEAIEASAGAGLAFGAFKRSRLPLGLRILWKGVKVLAEALKREPLDKSKKAAAEEEKKKARAEEKAKQEKTPHEKGATEDIAEARRAENAVGDASKVGEAGKSVEELKEVNSATKAARSAAEVADMEKAATIAKAGRAIAEIGEASKLARLVKAGGPVGLVASIVAIPLAANVAVRATAAPGESAEETAKLASKASSYVAFTDDSKGGARENWRAGNYGNAIGQEAKKTFEDTGGFLKLAYNEPQKAWAETREAAEDLAELGRVVLKDPAKLGETLRAAVKDEDLVQAVRKGDAMRSLDALQNNKDIAHGLSTLKGGSTETQPPVQSNVIGLFGNTRSPFGALSANDNGPKPTKTLRPEEEKTLRPEEEEPVRHNMSVTAAYPKAVNE